ncbi:MAG: SPOR domain-containing protein [Aquificae bacterium]|nr:SPOR domain-containing protein [Aquificota bacterium]
MERDIKHTIKNLESKRKKIEKIEKIILFLSGIILIIIFSIIGLNIYSGIGQKVSEPEIEVISGKKLEPKKEVIIQKPKDKKVEQTQNKTQKEQPTPHPRTKPKAIPSSFYTIQVGAFKTKTNAEKFIKEKNLKDAFIVHDQKLYKVMVGKFKTKKEAFVYLKKNKIKGFVKKLKSTD